MDTFLPFAKPAITQLEIDDVVDSLTSGWLTTGPKTQAFEADLAAYIGRPAYCLNSATAGLHLALLSLNLQPGDEVIAPAMTFVATYNAIELAGGHLRLVDVDPQTYNLTPEAVEAAITPKTRAIVPVHFAGLPVDLDPLYDIAEAHQLRVIEDCAHAIGAAYRGQKVGSFGDTHVFSFHPNKNMTSGEGGCVTTADEAMGQFVKTMRFHGIDRDAFNRFAKEGSQYYDIVAPGFKYNMLDLQAAIGRHQLARLDGFIDCRKALVDRYYDALSDCDALVLPQMPSYSHRHAWHLFAPLVNTAASGISRDDLMSALKARNIGTGLHYHPPHLSTYYANRYGFKRGDFPHAERIGDAVFSLPLFPDLTEAQQDAVIEAVLATVTTNKRKCYESGY